MNILSVLTAGSSLFHGQGVNHEDEAFVAGLQVKLLEAGRAALLLYTAKLEDGTVVHTESTLLGTGPDGNLWLWPVMSEIPVVLPHPAVETKNEDGQFIRTVFGSGPRDDRTVFREEITLQVNANGSLIYAHAWGLPGGAFEDRSSCSLLPSGA